jgi:patatin-like phospholipase/acyl hydrolase
MEALLRKELGKPDLVLADHFQFMAGTSTGAIIASLLAWGEPVAKVRKLYDEHCREIFPRLWTWKIWRLARLATAFYDAQKLEAFLKRQFKEKDPWEKHPALLRTHKLKTLLLVCLRNASTGSAWPITNNPMATFNRGDAPENNLNIPLWELVRASTAAPIYFRPKEITLGKDRFAFVDGGVTPYNNPALIAYLMATLPCYHLQWPTGVDNLLVVSIGTGRIRSVLKSLSIMASNIGINLMEVPAGLMENISLQQDFLCRVLGKCLFGDVVDQEIGTLMDEAGQEPGTDKKFGYVRYDHRFKADEILEAVKNFGKLNLDNVRTMPLMSQLGKDYADKNVKIEHLL